MTIFQCVVFVRIALYSECGEKIPVVGRRVYTPCPPIGVVLCWSRLGQMLSMELLIEYITRLRLGRYLKSLKLIYCRFHRQRYTQEIEYCKHETFVVRREILSLNTKYINRHHIIYFILPFTIYQFTVMHE